MRRFGSSPSGGDRPDPGGGLRRAGWVLVALVGAGCALSSSSAERFHGHYEAARYRSAVELFRADTTLRRKPEVLARMGILHASPASPVYDPDRALEVFRVLRDRHPGSPARRSAELLIPLLRKVQGLETAVDSLVSRTRRVTGVRLDSLAATSDSLRSETRALRSRVRELETVIVELRSQLRQLKAVDLQENPPPDTAGGVP